MYLLKGDQTESQKGIAAKLQPKREKSREKENGESSSSKPVYEKNQKRTTKSPRGGKKKDKNQTEMLVTTKERRFRKWVRFSPEKSANPPK